MAELLVLSFLSSKNAFFSTSVPETGEEKKPPNIFNIHKEAADSSNNLRPQGVRTSGLVPHVLAKLHVLAKPPSQAKPAATTGVPGAKKVTTTTTPVDDSDSEEEDLLG